MLVYLTHPKHGVHIAYSKEEVEACLRNGWTIRPEKQPTLTLPKKKVRNGAQ